MSNVKILRKPEACKGQQVRWEVVLYQNPRHLECFGQIFEHKYQAVQFAWLNAPNPNWSEIVVHCVLKRFC